MVVQWGVEFYEYRKSIFLDDDNDDGLVRLYFLDWRICNAYFHWVRKSKNCNGEPFPGES